MSTAEKRLWRLYSVPADLRWDELVIALAAVGFAEDAQKGSSYRKFVNKDGRVIYLHRPHPAPYVKCYAIGEVIATLRELNIVPGETK